MSLQETVSLILGESVSVEDAKEFAHKQFGVLADYIRSKSDNPKYKYLEIVEDDTNEVVKRIGVSNGNDKQIEKIKRGMSINLNHSKYSIRTTLSNTELPFISK